MSDIDYAYITETPHSYGLFLTPINPDTYYFSYGKCYGERFFAIYSTLQAIIDVCKRLGFVLVDRSFPSNRKED